jgi:hypothetical protein
MNTLGKAIILPFQQSIEAQRLAAAGQALLCEMLLATSTPKAQHSSIKETQAELASDDARMAKNVALLIAKSPQVKGRTAASAAAAAAAPKMMGREVAALAAAVASAPKHRNSIDQAYEELESIEARRAKIVASLISKSPQVKCRAAASAAAAAAAPKMMGREAAALAAAAASTPKHCSNIDHTYEEFASIEARRAKHVASLIRSSPQVKGRTAAAAAASAAAPKMMARQAGQPPPTPPHPISIYRLLAFSIFYLTCFMCDLLISFLSSLTLLSGTGGGSCRK